MNRRNIVQFKPEGVANIFSPTIRIHGEASNKNNIFKDAANKHDNSYVNYPPQPTVTYQREQMAQEVAKQNNYDEVYEKLFGNLMSNEYIGDDISNNLLSDVGAPIPSGVSSVNYEVLASEKLKSLADCIKKGGNCVHREKCEPHNKIAHCFNKDYTCCKETSEPGNVSPGRDASATHGGWVDNMNNNAGSESGDIGYLKWQTSSGGEIQRQDMRDTRQSGSKTQRGRREQGDVKGVESNYFGLSGYGNASESDPYFCATFCGGSYDQVTGEWESRPCVGECAKCSNCGKEPEQKTSGSSISRILFDKNRYTNSQLNRIDPDEYIKKISDLKAKISADPENQTLKNNLEKIEKEYERKVQKCRGLSENQCNTDPDCFNCISTSTSNDLLCKKHPDNSKIGVCDTDGARACVPIYKVSGVDKADTLMPFRSLEDYQQGSGYYSIDDKNLKYYNTEKKKLEDKEKSKLTHILEYPKKCKGPIDREYTYEEQRRDSGIDRRSYY